ncbi:MAG: hypothetical protein IJL87_07390 [Clostridia bacterium]|nr:hypothetical protein [Clostridia bacterium]
MFKNISRSAIMTVFVILSVGFLASACILSCAGVETSACIMAVCSCFIALIGIIVLSRYAKTPETAEKNGSSGEQLTESDLKE